MLDPLPHSPGSATRAFLRHSLNRTLCSRTLCSRHTAECQLPPSVWMGTSLYKAAVSLQSDCPSQSLSPTGSYADLTQCLSLGPRLVSMCTRSEAAPSFASHCTSQPATKPPGMCADLGWTQRQLHIPLCLPTPVRIGPFSLFSFFLLVHKGSPSEPQRVPKWVCMGTRTKQGRYLSGLTYE